jgi:PIN domain nuclease of toxin-antitoxin system
MIFLFDTHVVLSLLNDQIETDYPFVVPLLSDRSSCAVSVASLWEIAIKARLGKLECPVKIDELGPYLTIAGFRVLPITDRQVTCAIRPDVATRDPFDRLLVAVAQSEDMRLVTADRALADHPVTFRG